MTNAKVKALTNDQLVRLNHQWRVGQVYHAALCAADRIHKKKVTSRRRLVKILLQEFESLMS